jgi:hypothetical protein
MVDKIFLALLALGLGYIVYSICDNRSYKKGYQQAKADDSRWIQKASADSMTLRAENTRLAQENGSLCKENDIVKNLLRQQPTTPQAEAILKSLQRVELRLVEALPSILDDGENHDVSLN